MSTFGGLLWCTTFGAGLSTLAEVRGRELCTGGLSADFGHLSARRNVPGTAVDSTFHDLLCLTRSGSFLLTAQIAELLRSPF